MKLRIIGDSHTAALWLGWHALTQAGQASTNYDVDIAALGSGVYLQQIFFDAEGDGLGWTIPDFAMAFEALTGSKRLVAEADCVYGLCMGFHTGEVVRRAEWRQYSPWRTARETDLTPLSDAIVGEAAKQYTRPVLAFFDALTSLRVPFFVISAPPFKRDHFCMTQEGTVPAVAIEVDRLFREAIAAEVSARGLVSVMPPRLSSDSAGFLLPVYAVSREDPHHANADYGKLIMPDIVAGATTALAAMR